MQFKKKKVGYGQLNISETLQNYRSYVGSRKVLLPGEGERVLSLLEGVIDYSNSTKDLEHLNIYNLTTTVFSVIDKILNHKHSLMNQSVRYYHKLSAFHDKFRFSK